MVHLYLLKQSFETQNYHTMMKNLSCSLFKNFADLIVIYYQLVCGDLCFLFSQFQTPLFLQWLCHLAMFGIEVCLNFSVYIL